MHSSASKKVTVQYIKGTICLHPINGQKYHLHLLLFIKYHIKPLANNYAIVLLVFMMLLNLVTWYYLKSNDTVNSATSSIEKN